MNKLAVNFAGVDFKNPVIPASGTFGYGKEYEEFYINEDDFYDLIFKVFYNEVE